MSVEYPLLRQLPGLLILHEAKHEHQTVSDLLQDADLRVSQQLEHSPLIWGKSDNLPHN
jgi:hypothetical protein